MASSEWMHRFIPYSLFPIPYSLFPIPYSLFALLSRFRGEFFALLDRLVDGADHVEGGFGQVIVFAFAQALEAADGVGEVDEHARRAGEHFGDVERLRQEALDFPRPGDGELVLF